MAAFAGRLSTAENIDILLDACLKHLTDALRGQGSTSNAIDFSWGLALAFLDDREGYFAIITHYGTADELALERLILNESTTYQQAGNVLSLILLIFVLITMGVLRNQDKEASGSGGMVL